MQEELDYLDETIPKQSDDDLLSILAINAAAHSPLAIEFTVDVLKARGFKVKQTAQGFEVVTPAGGELNFPWKARPSEQASENYAHPGGAGAAREQELVGVGGWLGLLIFDLAVFSPLLFLSVLYALGFGINVIGHYPLLGWLLLLDRVSGMAIACVSIYAGVKLYKVRPGAVRFTKRFLVISGVYVTLMTGLIYLAAANTGVPAIKESAGGVPVLIVSAWLGRVVWYLYLSYSGRVAATYVPAIRRGA